MFEDTLGYKTVALTMVNTTSTYPLLALITTHLVC
ncbi:hypothetical protein CPS_1158 [Colwellia psychrerythraea 34H]|uniref:Uncharacterized protein n=1 Tax=Colwellia psychrerythraea (strain 34H / ATCC BAA-681) TaxID=167879 RepID=Q486W4_COLP3|nr:hypothetical protein CPS_1158 [Colwellia psychrerythraea 34H]